MVRQRRSVGLGSQAGDQLLIETARRLRRRLRESDAALLATALLDAIAEPWSDAGREVVVTASIGLAMAPVDGGDQEAAQSTIQPLTQLGIRFAIDDFGTGYSSFSKLRRLQADTLKIEASFIRDLTSSADAQAIVRVILHMARGMGTRTLAEGVERRQEPQFLLEQGCDEIQGYLFSEPLPPAAFLDELKRHRQESRAPARRA